MVHLHVHTGYSYKDGIIRAKDLSKKLTQIGQKAVAITDHGTMSGVMEFTKVLSKNGIKVIPGIEAYCGKQKSHLVLLAKNEEGYKNLLKITTMMNTNDKKEFLNLTDVAQKELGKGIICTTACLGGEIARLLNGYQKREDVEEKKQVDNKDKEKEKDKDKKKTKKKAATNYVCFPSFKEAIKYVNNLKLVFDEVYLELQANEIPLQKRLNRNLQILAAKTKTGLTISTDAHYLNQEDYVIHNIVRNFNSYMKVTHRTPLINLKGFDGSPSYYIQTDEEVRKYCRDNNIPETVVDMTEEIADKCQISFFGDNTSVYENVSFPTVTERPLNGTSEVNLEDFVYPKMAEYYQKYLRNSGIPYSQYSKRIAEELEVIKFTGISEYILLTYQFIKACESAKIPVGLGRGSAAGSVVCFALGITRIDPVKNNLRFDRFLTNERISMPDIDNDVSSLRRPEAIEFLNFLGEGKVSYIIAVYKFTTRTLIRNILSAVRGIVDTKIDKNKGIIQKEEKLFKNYLNEMVALGYDPKEGIELYHLAYFKPKEFDKLYPKDPNQIKIKAKKFFKDLEERDIDPEVFCRAIDILDNVPDHSGTHASGLAVSSNDISDYSPLRINKGLKITEYDKHVVEDIRLLKLDVLGLLSLDILQQTIEQVQEIDPSFDIQKINSDDEKTFKLLRNGWIRGVFQMDKNAKRYTPNFYCLDDMIVVNALNRPGPLNARDSYGRNMPEQYFYCSQNRAPVLIDERVDYILEETYGVIIYQEQAMELVKVLTGCTDGYADKVRKAMGHKDQELMEQLKYELKYGIREKTYNFEGEYAIHEDSPYVLDAGGAPLSKGALANGFEEEVADRIINNITEFAKYAFNKSHAAAYALTSYQMAYMKANYPLQFYKSLMDCHCIDNKKESDINKNVFEDQTDEEQIKKNQKEKKKDQVSAIIGDIKELTSIILPDEKEAHFEFYDVDINTSKHLCSVEEKGIRAGLIVLLKNEQMTLAIQQEREARGPFTSLEDFLKRTDGIKRNGKKLLTKIQIDTLIKGGAFDYFCHPMQSGRPNRAKLYNEYLAYRKEKQFIDEEHFDDAELFKWNMQIKGYSDFDYYLEELDKYELIKPLPFTRGEIGVVGYIASTFESKGQKGFILKLKDDTELICKTFKNKNKKPLTQKDYPDYMIYANQYERIKIGKVVQVHGTVNYWKEREEVSLVINSIYDPAIAKSLYVNKNLNAPCLQLEENIPRKFEGLRGEEYYTYINRIMGTQLYYEVIRDIQKRKYEYQNNSNLENITPEEEHVLNIYISNQQIARNQDYVESYPRKGIDQLEKEQRYKEYQEFKELSEKVKEEEIIIDIDENDIFT